MRRCKLCGEILLEEEALKHIVREHKEEIMKRIKSIRIKCQECKKYFSTKPEPIYTDDLKWVVPVSCKKCAGVTYGFIVDYIPEEKVSFR